MTASAACYQQLSNFPAVVEDTSHVLEHEVVITALYCTSTPWDALHRLYPHNSLHSFVGTLRSRCDDEVASPCTWFSSRRPNSVRLRAILLPILCRSTCLHVSLSHACLPVSASNIRTSMVSTMPAWHPPVCVHGGVNIAGPCTQLKHDCVYCCGSRRT